MIVSIAFINFILMTLCANCFLICYKYPLLTLVFLPLFIVANIIPSFSRREFYNLRLRICYHGNMCLRQFLCSAVISVIIHAIIAVHFFQTQTMLFISSAIVCIVIEAVFFWNGIISLYCTSVQLGIKLRVIGALCGMIPIVNLIVLGIILRITSLEIKVETKKAQLNEERKHKEICKTKYPILLVHGVFFRDFKLLNYWGRIPAELKKNGASVFYGNHQSARAVADSAAELTERIKQIVNSTGCEKVNIIAHSKGGLDCRYAISHLNAAPYVASLTTINTPHRGCKFADFLLEKAPDSLRKRITKLYNDAFEKLGDENPDFMAAVTDLTSSTCIELDKSMIAPNGVKCSSIGSIINHPLKGKFPLNLTYHLVHLFDGPNDGLVGIDSFEWGDSYTLLKTSDKRGISHMDIIDLGRENLPNFDVREFYVNMVSELKKQGL